MKSKTAGLLVIALIVAVGLGIFAFSNKPNKEPLPTPFPTAEVRKSTVNYKDGVYEQLGNYMSPAGAEQIDVKVTLKNGIITESDVTAKASQPISKMKQEAFINGYKSFVVGKNINDLQLGKVAGASLTPKGFNDALEKIKAQAKTV